MHKRENQVARMVPKMVEYGFRLFGDVSRRPLRASLSK